MKVLNLLTSGEAGGIESLCRDIGLNAEFENGFCFLFQGGAIYEQMKSLGLVTYNLSGIGKDISLKKYKALKKIAQDYDIIVVHNGNVKIKLYHCRLAKSLKSKKFVTVAHSCYEKEFMVSKNKIKNFIVDRVFQKDLDLSDLNLYVSNAGKKTYAEHFRISEEKAKVVYNGIGQEKIKIGMVEKYIPKKPLQVSYIGRLIKAKGVDLLIRAIAKLSSECDVKLSIVGDGEERKNLEQLTRELKLENNITFYGRQTDVIPYLKDTDIFVYPSTWQEVFGISIVEAMAFGKPCIANRVGGIPEIITDGVNGYLTDEPTAEGVYRSLKRVIYDIESKNIKKISENAKQTAQAFSIKETVKKLNEVYSEIL